MSSTAPISRIEVGNTLSGVPMHEQVREVHARARGQQTQWGAISLKQRLLVIRRLRESLAEQGETLAETVRNPGRTNLAETLAAEVIPLADACRFLERDASKILGSQALGSRGRPGWLSGVRIEKRWEPLGIVLIVGAANYPLLLSGVQMLQALVVGNAVLLKPGRRGTRPARALLQLCEQAGLPAGLVGLLPEDPSAVDCAIESGVDKLVLTGSAETGRTVLTKLASSLTPATMELSGCDAVFVQPQADLDLVAKALTFGLYFNNSETCIAPRRVFVPRQQVTELQTRLTRCLADRQSKSPSRMILGSTARLIDEAINSGAVAIWGRNTAAWQPGVISTPVYEGPVVLAGVSSDMTLFQSDVFAPVLGLFACDSDDEALRLSQSCPYALGATIFGSPKTATSLAAKIDAGCVVINDILVPTADPRIAFGGRHDSGFGLTRGPEGLREMAQLKTIITRRTRWLPHLETPSEHDQDILAGYLGYSHAARWSTRLKSLQRLIRAALAQSRQQRQQKAIAKASATRP